MLKINFMSNEDIKDISMIVFDVDGILVRRGTEIRSDYESLYIKYKHILNEEQSMIHKLMDTDKFMINISSGRSLSLLMMMFEPILSTYTTHSKFSITYENGSASWLDVNGQIYQNVFATHNVLFEVKKRIREIRNKDIIGFEPKEFILTLHCERQVLEVEKLLTSYRTLYCIWNGEAYDIGFKLLQTKADGLIRLCKILEIEPRNVMYIGDNYNDTGVSEVAGITITADPDRLYGKFSVPIDDVSLPASIVIGKILELLKYD